MTTKIPNIVFKSLLQGIKDIKKRNEYFDYLSDEGKRLEIAWDALQLIQKEILFTAGASKYYWNSDLFALRQRVNDAEAFQVELCNLTNIKNCSVCARGGIMVSRIRLGNKIAPNSDNVDCGGENNLDVFNLQVMKDMENEYEISKFTHPYGIGSTNKLMNIYCNILVNGNFNPTDSTDYLIDA